MCEILSQIYEKTAQKLCDLVCNTNYYSGTIEFAYEDIECRFVASLIIYRKKVEMPDGCLEVIDDLVPVWWEFHTTIAGVEYINDFDFSLFKKYIVS